MFSLARHRQCLVNTFSQQVSRPRTIVDSLGAKHFEELQIMKFAWRKSQGDPATWNSSQIEEIDLDDYNLMLEAEDTVAELDSVVDGLSSEHYHNSG